MERLEPIATVLSIRRDRARDPATRPSVQVVRGSVGAGARRTTFDDVSLVVCFLALAGVLVLGVALTLFSWVTATLPTISPVACNAPYGCGSSVTDIPLPSPDNPGTDAPNQIP